MSTFDVSVIKDVDSYFECLANKSCCGASNFIKKVAKAAIILDRESKIKFLEQLSQAPEGQLNEAWKTKALDLLAEP